MVGKQVEEKDILLAEDDRDDVALFQMAMDELDIDYRLRHAENGDILMVMLRESVPYILFLDLAMPCRDGLSSMAEIRKNREYDSLPIVIYSGNRQATKIEECYRNSANLYLVKPTIFRSMVDNLKLIFSINWSTHTPYPAYRNFVLS